MSQIQSVRILKCNVSLKYLPAYVEADCCRDCNCPRLQLYLFATVPKGTSFTRSCSTRVVKNLRASERKEDGNYKGFSQTKEYTFSSNEIYPLFVLGLGFFPRASHISQLLNKGRNVRNHYAHNEQYNVIQY